MAAVVKWLSLGYSNSIGQGRQTVDKLSMLSGPFVPADWLIPRVLRYRLGYGPGVSRLSRVMATTAEPRLQKYLSAENLQYVYLRLGCGTVCWVILRMSL